MRGPGPTSIEPKVILPEGRISQEDVALWSDEHIEPLTRISTEFSHSQGQKIGIQLSYARHKVSATPPWVPGNIVRSEEAGGWPDHIWGPSQFDGACAKGAHQRMHRKNS